MKIDHSPITVCQRVLPRPNWDEYFLGVAYAVSARADCRRAKRAVVLVDCENRIISTGYNGAPPGGPSCLAGECPRGLSSDPSLPADYTTCVALHAEMNAVAWADRSRTRGATAYLVGGKPPCDMCAKLLEAAGVSRVVWR